MGIKAKTCHLVLLGLNLYIPDLLSKSLYFVPEMKVSYFKNVLHTE